MWRVAGHPSDDLGDSSERLRHPVCRRQRAGGLQEKRRFSNWAPKG